MAAKKKVKKNSKTKKKKTVKSNSTKNTAKKKNTVSKKNIPTLQFKNERDIAMDFATKLYKKFDKIIKSVILFGSTTKKTQVAGSDIDIIIVIDDASIKWDQELIAWYRQELETLLKSNPYQKNLHINTVKLSTWWEDLKRGDPIILNVLRNGESLIDMAGFFDPLKYLLIQGKIKSSPEAIYSTLQRAPLHLARSKSAELNTIEGVYWCMVDAAHSALIAAEVSPPSPEHIPEELNLNFVQANKLKSKYVQWYKETLDLHKKISHGEIRDLKGAKIDQFQERAEEFLSVMAKLVNDMVS